MDYRDGEALVEDLDRDVALEVLVPCAPHDGHAAASCDAAVTGTDGSSFRCFAAATSKAKESSPANR